MGLIGDTHTRPRGLPPFFYHVSYKYHHRHPRTANPHAHAWSQVGIIMGSDSDLPTMKDAAEVLEAFGVKYELTIVSAHRTPTRMYEYAQSAARRGVQVRAWVCVCVEGWMQDSNRERRSLSLPS